LAGAVVTDTTAGLAAVKVAVCVAVVSEKDQFVSEATAATASVTYSVVAICVLSELAGGVTAKLTLETVCTPLPASEVITALPPTDVDSLNVVDVQSVTRTK
jgi:hypothetical protein